MLGRKAALVGLATVSLATAHPSGLEQGRASCGLEYHTAAEAYVVADPKEAWYLRRIQTCDAPFFWTRFTTTEPKQKVTMTVVTPQIERFQDKVQFRAIVFATQATGFPKLDLDDVPAALKSGAKLPSLYGYLLKPAANDEDICAMVDRHPVMTQYNEVDADGRCSEAMKMDADYEKPVMANETWKQWWLYAENLYKASPSLKSGIQYAMLDTPGDYWIVSWIENRNDKHELITGKYEMTIAPNIWFDYADEDTMTEAHEQLSTCTCGNNYAMWTEQHLERIGEDKGTDTYQQELPYLTCPAGSGAVTKPTAPEAQSTAFEWAGAFELKKGVNYTWVLNRNCKLKDQPAESCYGYNDTTLEVVVLRSDSAATDKAAILGKLAQADTMADQARTGTGGPGAPPPMPLPDEPGAPDGPGPPFMPGPPEPLVFDGDYLSSGLHMEVQLDASLPTTTVTFRPDQDGTFVLFAQHNAKEFGATMLGDVAAGSSAEWNTHDHGDDSSTAGPPERKCYAATPMVDLEKVLEFSGTWAVPAGTYTWTLRAERSSATDEYAYHEPQMLIYAAEADMDSTRVAAEAAIKNAGKGLATPDVRTAGGTIRAADTAQQLKVNAAALPASKTTEFKVEVAGDDGITLFTQHMPWEFAAIYMQAADGTKYWPAEARNYVLEGSGAYVPPSADAANTGKGLVPDAAKYCGPGTKFDAEVSLCVLDCGAGRRAREATLDKPCLDGKCGGGATNTAPQQTMKVVLTGIPADLSPDDKRAIEDQLLKKLNDQITALAAEKRKIDGTTMLVVAPIESVSLDPAAKVVTATFKPATTAAQAQQSEEHLNEDIQALGRLDMSITRPSDSTTLTVSVTETKAGAPPPAPAEKKKKGGDTAVLVVVVVFVLVLIAGAVLFTNSRKKAKAVARPTYQDRSFGGDGVQQAGTAQEFANPVANRAFASEA